MFWIWKDKIADLEKKIKASEEKIRVITEQGKQLYQHGRYYSEEIDSFFAKQLAFNSQEAELFIGEYPAPNVGDWIDEAWGLWHPKEATLEQLIRIGEYVESQGNYGFKIPHYAPFIGSDSTIVITSNDQTSDQAIALLQSLATRIALMLPHQARYTLIDPVGSGAAFPMQRYLPFVRERSDDIRRDLDQVSKDIQRIIATYLDAESDSFETLPEDIRINERLEFILAANFPKRYDRRAIEALQSVGMTGPKAGKYLILHYNQSQELPRDMSMKEFENAIYINLSTGYRTLPTNSCQLIFNPDIAPSPGLQKKLFGKLSEAKPPQRNLSWDKTVGIPEEQWWSETAAEILETPIGGYGSSEYLKIWFGEKAKENTCAHGILGGTAGSGKSNLYHVLITGLSIRYAPDDLRMYLVDGKYGVTFQPYRDLPHAEVVSLHTPSELSRSVISELVVQMDYRYDVFSKVGVEKLSEYYAKEQPRGKLPRILLLVDEYQELFQGDQDGIASSNLLKLSQQGRAAGIHMLLGSQGFTAVGMLHRESIFQNLHLLMAMRMKPDDIQALTCFGRRGKQLIATCDLAGKIVLNDQLGAEDANRLGKVALLEKKDRDPLIQSLKEKAHRHFSSDQLPLGVVLDGEEQPNIIDNPHLRSLLEHSRWLNAREWQERARQTLHLGGLGIFDWLSAECPRAMWLGQEFNVYGQAMMLLRRRLAENVVFVGGENTVRYGMLVGILASLAVSADSSKNRFFIFDRSMAETQWHEALRLVTDLVLKPAKFSVEFTRNRKFSRF